MLRPVAMRRALLLAPLFVGACSGGCGSSREHDAGGATSALGDDAGAVVDLPAADTLDASPDAEPVDAADEGALDASAPPPPACPDDMALAGDACVDRYEAPNVAGARPLAFRTAPEGEAWCADRGKRLCTEAEWVRACEGSTGRKFPYGDTYERGRCDDDKTWLAPDWQALATYPGATAVGEATRLYQADPSGTRPGCVSEDGVFDLAGNVAEWVVRSFEHPNEFGHVMKGCYWSGCYGGAPPGCGFTNPAHPGTFRSYEAGFRCCKDPE